MSAANNNNTPGNYVSFPTDDSAESWWAEQGLDRAEGQIFNVPAYSEAEFYARNVQVEDGADAVAIGQRAGFGPDGLQMVLNVDHPEDRPFNPEEADQYLAGDPTLVLGTRSNGNGYRRSVELTKKASDRSDSERVPDEARQEKLKIGFAKFKHALGLTSEYEVDYLSLGSLIITIKKDGRLVGTFNLRDLGLIEPDGPIVGGGGLQQLLRVTYPGTIFTREQLEEKRAELNEINTKDLRKHVQRETGKKLFDETGVSERMGSAEGHRPLQIHGENARKLIEGEDGGINHRTLTTLGYVDTSRSTGSRTRYTFNNEGKKAFKSVGKARALQELLLRNLKAKIAEKAEERRNLLPRTEQNAGRLDQLEKEIRELQNAKNEVVGVNINRAALILPLLLLHQTFKIQVYEIDSSGQHVRNPDGSPKLIPVEFTIDDLFKSKAEMDTPEFKRRFAIAPGDNLDAFRNKLIRVASEKAAEKLKDMIQENNPQRSFPNVWHTDRAGWKPEDNQLVTDVQGIIHQMVARPSSEPAFATLTGFVEEKTSSKLAQESRAAAFLGFSALHEIPRPTLSEAQRNDPAAACRVELETGRANDLRLHTYAGESDVVRQVFLESLNEFDALYRAAPLIDPDKAHTGAELAARYGEGVARIQAAVAQPPQSR